MFGLTDGSRAQSSLPEPLVYLPLDAGLDNDGARNFTITSIGGPQPESKGVVGGAFQFDNSSEGQGVRIAPLGFSAGDDLTFSAWVQFSRFEGGFSETAPHTVARFFGNPKEDGSGPSVLEFRVRDGSLDAYYTKPQKNNFAPALMVPVGEWVFVGLTVKGGTLTLYLNDKSQSFPIDGGQPYDAVFVGTSASTGTAARGVNGLMDEVRVYDRALSAQDMKELYRQGREALARQK